MHTLRVQIDDAVITDLQKTAQQQAQSVDELVQYILQKYLQQQLIRKEPRKPGSLKNQIKMADDFDAEMSNEKLALWHDSPLFPTE